MVSQYKLTWESYKTHITTNHFHKDEKILDDYSYAKSDKRKEQVINEFKQELSYDLRSLVGTYSRREKSTDAPLEDDIG